MSNLSQPTCLIRSQAQDPQSAFKVLSFSQASNFKFGCDLCGAFWRKLTKPHGYSSQFKKAGIWSDWLPGHAKSKSCWTSLLPQPLQPLPASASVYDNYSAAFVVLFSLKNTPDQMNRPQHCQLPMIQHEQPPYIYLHDAIHYTHTEEPGAPRGHQLAARKLWHLLWAADDCKNTRRIGGHDWS